MKTNMFEYACRVTLRLKKDGNCKFCGDYHPLNQQTLKDAFTMLLVDDVLTQLGRSWWFSTLDLQFRFWQIKMSREDVNKTTLITKFDMFNWNVCLLVWKMPLVPFQKPWPKVLESIYGQVLEFFLLLTSTYTTWHGKTTWNISDLYYWSWRKWTWNSTLTNVSLLKLILDF